MLWDECLPFALLILMIGHDRETSLITQLESLCVYEFLWIIYVLSCLSHETSCKSGYKGISFVNKGGGSGFHGIKIIILRLSEVRTTQNWPDLSFIKFLSFSPAEIIEHGSQSKNN